MKRALTLAALLTLTGCSSPDTPHVSATPTPNPTTNTRDVAYITNVRVTVKGSTDTDLIRVGKQTCDEPDDLTAASTLVTQGFNTADAAAIVTAAHTVYCP